MQGVNTGLLAASIGVVFVGLIDVFILLVVESQEKDAQILLNL